MFLFPKRPENYTLSVPAHATPSVIYETDRAFYLYQDGLKWSRFQWASILEAGWLTLLFQQTVTLPKWAEWAIPILGFLLIACVCLLSMKDAHDAMRHLWRMQAAERSHGFPEPTHKWPSNLSGDRIWFCMIVLLMLVNVFVVVGQFCA